MLKIKPIRINKYFIKENLPLVISLAILTVISFLLVTAVKGYFEMSGKLSTGKDEVAQLKHKVDVLSLGKALTEDQIDEYNQLLSVLIPESEDYFSVIVALEKLSRDSGFIVTSYSLSFSGGKTDKLTIIVEGNGDINSFLTFLKNYKFSGGRLITSEKIDFSDKALKSSKISLNFYNKKVTTNSGTQDVPQLTKADIDLLNDIKSKTKVILKAPDAITPDNYAIKANPF